MPPSLAPARRAGGDSGFCLRRAHSARFPECTPIDRVPRNFLPRPSFPVQTAFPDWA